MNEKEREGTLCNICQIMVQLESCHRFLSSNVAMGASHLMCSFCLCSYVQGEGNTPQVAVSGRIVDDALAIELALYLDVSVELHS